MAAAAPDIAAAGFVRDRADLWELTEDDVATVEVQPVSRRGLRTVRLLQRVGGVEVFNSDVTVAVNADNEVFAVAGQLFRGAATMHQRARGLAGSDAAPAIVAAAAHLTGARFDRA
jgi:Zn-dependent metalloprotease